MDSDPYGFCYRLERDVVKVLDKGGLAAFERCMCERFDGIGTAAASFGDRAPNPVYVKRRAAEILRAIYARQRNVDAYVALTEATELAPADCLALAEMLQARRKAEQALAWVERDLAESNPPRRTSAACAKHGVGTVCACPVHHRCSWSRRRRIAPPIRCIPTKALSKRLSVPGSDTAVT
jgi:hypothetical protein